MMRSTATGIASISTGIFGYQREVTFCCFYTEAGDLYRRPLQQFDVR
jgi:hypothetical protein